MTFEVRTPATLKWELPWGFCYFLTQNSQKLLLMTFARAKTFVKV